MASNYLATILALTKPDASAGLFTTVNSLTNAATEVGGVATFVPTTGVTFESTTSNGTDVSLRCANNSLPINYRSIWTDFGIDGQTDSHGWNYNAEGEDPNTWGMAVVLETPYAGLLEYWWSYQAPTASAFATWRSMFSHVTQATSVAEVEWKYDKMKWYGNPNRNVTINPLFEINTFNEIITSNAAFGVGADPRADENGAMFKVAGSAGTSVEHTVIAPTTLAETGTVVSVQIPSVADATGFGVQGAVSGTLNNLLRNTHATGAIRDTLWGVGGAVSHRYLNTNADFAAGITAAGVYKLAASFDLDTSTVLSVNKTTLLATLYGGLDFSGTTHHGIKLNSLTTTQRDALTPAAGMLIHNTTTGQAEYYTSAWGALGGAGGDVATDAIWDAAGDLAVGSGSNTAVRLAMGTALQVLGVNAGATGLEWAAVTGTGSVVRAAAPTITGILTNTISGNSTFVTGASAINIFAAASAAERVNITKDGTFSYVKASVFEANTAGGGYSWTAHGRSLHSSGLRVLSTDIIGAQSGTAFEAVDTGLRRNAAGVWEINNGTSGQFRDLRLRNLINTLTTPASATATGVAGTITFDADFVYCCTATDTWKRVAIATWP